MATMIRRASIALLALAACASPPPQRPAFEFQGLREDAPTYVALRYDRSELPAALIADLEADGFTCQHSATVSECARSIRTSPVCFNVAIVRISNTAPVYAEQNPRCMGANP